MKGALTFLKEFQALEHASAGPVVCEPVRTVEQAYREGVSDGVAKAQAEIGRETAIAIEALNAQLSEIVSIRDVIHDEAINDAGAAVSALISSLCPQLAAKGLASSARGLMLDELRKVPRPVVIKVAPESLEGLTAALAEHLSEDITLEAEVGFSPFDLQIEWFQGSASIETDAIAAQILKLADTLDGKNNTNKQGEA